MTAAPNVPALFVRDGIVLASSRDVASSFGKRHDHVLRAADDLVKKRPDLRPNFGAVEEPDEKGELRRVVQMDRKAFTLLVMGFTGEKALDWKIAYSDLFDQMEQALRSGAGTAIVEGFGPSARSTMGGIFKKVAHGELEEALVQALPRLVEPFFERLFAERFMSRRVGLTRGIRALEVADLLGFTRGNRPKGLSQFISGHLTRWHRDRHLPEERDGLFGTKLFNEAASRAWINSGGRAAVDRYVSERRGQGALKLVKLA